MIQAAKHINELADKHLWYVGDSVTDMMTATKAGVTRVFYNGALWSPHWFEQVFAANAHHHYDPDIIVDDFDELLDLVLESEGSVISQTLKEQRPARLPPRQLQT